MIIGMSQWDFIQFRQPGCGTYCISFLSKVSFTRAASNRIPHLIEGRQILAQQSEISYAEALRQRQLLRQNSKVEQKAKKSRQNS